MKNMIVVIDDGIELSDFVNVNCKRFYKADSDNIVEEILVHSAAGKYSHSTICAAIINHYCDDAEIISIKVLSETKTGTISKLVTAIEWCVAHSIPLINLSIGSVYIKDFTIINELLKSTHKKCTIVAAQNNNKYFTAPASFNEVIGVKHCSVYRDGQYKMQWYPFDGIEISASSFHSLKRRNGSLFYTTVCNSYAAPMITAKVYDILKDNNFTPMTKEQILLKLQNGALNVQGEYIKGLSPYCTSHNYSENRDVSKTSGFWDRTLYNKLVYPYIKGTADEISVPVINLTMYNRGVICTLLNILTSMEYNTCVILSDMTSDINCMYYIFVDTVKHIELCSYINKRMNYDLFITQSDKMTGDINISTENNEVVVEADGNSIRFPINDAGKCVEYILSILM